MIFDKQNLICDKTALPTAVATAQVGDAIDLWAGSSTQPNVALPQGVNGPIGGPAAAFIQRLDEVEMYIQVTTAVTGGGTGTIQFQLVLGDDATLTNPVVLKETPAITVDAAGANLPAGYVVRISGDLGFVQQSKRFIGLKTVNATAVLTAGAITAGVVADFQTLHF